MDGSFSQLRRREASKLYPVLHVCVCVCESVCVFDVVFTQLKAVSCVVSPQSYPPPDHTHAHLRQCAHVCYAQASERVFKETSRCRYNM